MSIVVPKWRFTPPMIGDAPDTRGVYVLWSHGAPLAVGHARGGDDTIRSRLQAHFAHGEASGMAEVTHYSWEICREPLKREAELVERLGLARPRAALEPAVEAHHAEEREWNARESS